MSAMNRCPVCVEQGLRSVFYPAEGAFATAMFTHAWYDEDGDRHFHDPNTRSSSAHCSVGHVIHTWWNHPCPSCDFGTGGDGWRRDQDQERKRATPHWIYKLNGEPPELFTPACPPDIERPPAPEPPEPPNPNAVGTWFTPATWMVGP